MTKAVPALVAEMVNLAPLGTPDPLDHPDPTVPLALAETLLLRWQEVLMRKLVVLKWA